SLVVKWPQGEGEGHFSYLWLRDNCPCPRCIHPDNRQKLHSSGDVPLDIKPTSVKVEDEQVTIAWSKELLNHSNSNPQAPHVSTYPMNWLKNNGSEESQKRFRYNHLSPVAWEPKTLGKENLRITYNEYMNSETGLLKCLRQLNDYGLCFLSGVPTEDEEVVKVAKRIGAIKETFYGKSWDVKSVPQAKNIAYTSLFLGLHMDLLYFESPPGVQLLHSLRNDAIGGDSIFLDSFKAVEILKERYPEDYKVLTDIPVTFHYINDGRHMHFRRPTIVDNSLNDHLIVNYAPPFQGPLEIPQEKMGVFYQAFQRFTSIIADPSLLYQTRLNQGDLVLFANRRVLHGRTAFDAASGPRHFKGTYIDLDDFKDRLRV
ncbi:Clavaminate synthase-like protein, partial [Basidiobolus meristosporus CBS 931.73]